MSVFAEDLLLKASKSTRLWDPSRADDAASELGMCCVNTMSHGMQIHIVSILFLWTRGFPAFS